MESVYENQKRLTPFSGFSGLFLWSCKKKKKKKKKKTQHSMYT